MRQRAGFGSVVLAGAVFAFPGLAAERELDEGPAPGSAKEIATPIQRVFPEEVVRPPLIPWIGKQLQKLPPSSPTLGSKPATGPITCARTGPPTTWGA